MRRITMALAACAWLAAGAASAEMQTYYGFQIGITNAPEAPRVQYRKVPHIAMVSGTNVYVADREGNDCDVFRHGAYWYVSTDGYWYRSQAYNGPYRVVDARKVPRSIFAVPDRHWKHHPHGGPQGLAHYDKHGRAKHGKAKRKAKDKVVYNDD